MADVVKPKERVGVLRPGGSVPERTAAVPVDVELRFGQPSDADGCTLREVEEHPVVDVVCPPNGLLRRVDDVGRHCPLYTRRRKSGLAQRGGVHVQFIPAQHVHAAFCSDASRCVVYEYLPGPVHASAGVKRYCSADSEYPVWREVRGDEVVVLGDGERYFLARPAGGDVTDEFVLFSGEYRAFVAEVAERQRGWEVVEPVPPSLVGFFCRARRVYGVTYLGHGEQSSFVVCACRQEHLRYRIPDPAAILAGVADVRVLGLAPQDSCRLYPRPPVVADGLRHAAVWRRVVLGDAIYPPLRARGVDATLVHQDNRGGACAELHEDTAKHLFLLFRGLRRVQLHDRGAADRDDAVRRSVGKTPLFRGVRYRGETRVHAEICEHSLGGRQLR